MRMLAYCGASTADRATENQMQGIWAAGFDIQAHQVIQEAISSSSVKAAERKEFSLLLKKRGKAIC